MYAPRQAAKKTLLVAPQLHFPSNQADNVDRIACRSDPHVGDGFLRSGPGFLRCQPHASGDFRKHYPLPVCSHDAQLAAQGIG